MRPFLVFLLTLALTGPGLAPSAFAQERGLFGSDKELSLTYALRLNRGGKVEKVTENQEFFREDQIQFLLEPERDCYAYLVMRGSSGKYQMLYPSRNIDGGKNWVKADAEMAVPPQQGFVIDHNPGVEQIFLFAAAEKIQPLETLLSQPAIQPQAFLDILLDLRNRQSEELAWTMETEADQTEITVKSETENPVLMHDFFIRHK